MKKIVPAAIVYSAYHNIVMIKSSKKNSNYLQEFSSRLVVFLVDKKFENFPKNRKKRNSMVCNYPAVGIVPKVVQTKKKGSMGYIFIS